MKFDFNPQHPQETASDVGHQLRLLAALFCAAGPNDLFLDEQALCALMTQLYAMAEAMSKVEDFLGEQQMKLAGRAA